MRNAIRDSLWMLSPVELDQILVNGVSCRQQLTIDKRKDREVKGSVVFGSTYYKTLRSRYSTSESLEVKLRLSKDNPVTAAFRVVFEGMLSHPPKRAQVRSWLVTLDEGMMTEADCQGLFLLLSMQSPHLSTDVFDLCVNILEHAARLRLPNHFPVIWDHIKPKVDEILLQVPDVSSE